MSEFKFNKIIVVNNKILDKYNHCYFLKYPRRGKTPIKSPIPPSLNEFISMIRMAQNDLKQKYKEFAIWLSEYYQINNMNLEKLNITYTIYFKDRRRRDFDNLMLIPKFFNDGFVESGVFVDDNGERLHISFAPFQYDKLNPRVEMFLEY